MLSADELAVLRTMIDEASTSTEWTDARLQVLAATNGNNLRSVAASVWETKAASYVEAVNITESGSSRSDSVMFDHAIAMAKRFSGPVDGTLPTVPTAARTRSTRIVRAPGGERG